MTNSSESPYEQVARALAGKLGRLDPEVYNSPISASGQRRCDKTTRPPCSQIGVIPDPPAPSARLLTTQDIPA